MKLLHCDSCLALQESLLVKPHLRVLMEDDVDLDSLFDTMQSQSREALVDSDSDSASGAYEDLCPRRSSPINSSPINREPHKLERRTSEHLPRPKSESPQCTRRMPKSQSMPLKQALPDPFPEISHTPVSSTTNVNSESSKSSPNSPVIRRGYSPESPKKRAIDNSSGRYPMTRSESAEQYSWQPRERAASIVKTMLNFYNDDRGHRSVSVEDTMCASDVIYTLVLKNQAKEDRHWALVENLTRFGLERSLEDHELVLPAYRNWAHSDGNKFYFRRDFRKYEFFQSPTQFFPTHMLDIKESKKDASDELLGKAERQRNLLLQNLLTGDSLPDIQGYLSIKEGKKSWKKHFFVLRQSGLYYSSKGTSKEPRHLVLFSMLQDVNIYVAHNAKKTLGAPNNFCIVLKPPYCVNDMKDLKILSAEDESARTCWLTGLRLVKYGHKLYENYKVACHREEKLRSIENHGSLGHSSTYVKQRVAMDFTGLGGRVVANPNEALGVAIEEGQHWRRKSKLPGKSSPLRCPSPPTYKTCSSHEGSPRMFPGLSDSLHLTQPWYHGNLSREHAISMITEQGLVDGVFLLRESQTLQGTFVLSLAHHHKVKHCQIHRVKVDELWYFSLDGGHTKFSDLIQLVDFYQINANGLPCPLTYPVTRLL